MKLDAELSVIRREARVDGVDIIELIMITLSALDNIMADWAFCCVRPKNEMLGQTEADAVGDVWKKGISLLFAVQCRVPLPALVRHVQTKLSPRVGFMLCLS